MNMRFVNTPEAISAMLESGMDVLMKKAEFLGATCGAGGVGLLFEGKLHTLSEPLRNDWALAFDPNKEWPGETEIGIDYLGYVLGKISLSARIKADSYDSPASGKCDYGESNSIGCVFSVLLLNCNENVELYAAFSGMTPDQDKEAAYEAVAAMELMADKLFA